MASMAMLNKQMVWVQMPTKIVVIYLSIRGCYRVPQISHKDGEKWAIKVDGFLPDVLRSVVSIKLQERDPNDR